MESVTLSFGLHARRLASIIMRNHLSSVAAAVALSVCTMKINDFAKINTASKAKKHFTCVVVAVVAALKESHDGF